MSNQNKALTQLTREELEVAQNFVRGWREGLISFDDVVELQEWLQSSTEALPSFRQGSEVNSSSRKLALIVLSEEELEAATWFISLFRDYPIEQSEFLAFLTCCFAGARLRSITPVHLQA